MASFWFYQSHRQGRITAGAHNWPNNNGAGNASAGHGQKCADCVYFEPPSGCKTVESPISPEAWCQLYTAKPA
jgi:hypothetical protein